MIQPGKIKVTKFAGLRIIVGNDSDKVDVIPENEADSREDSNDFFRRSSNASNLNPF